jgi:hypothetical protein
MRDGAKLFLISIAVLTLPAIAGAQVYVGGDAPRRGSFEAAGGAMFAPGFDMGSVTAELTRSTPTETFDLFTSDSEVSEFPGAFVRLGYYLAESVSVEGGFRYARPTLSVRLSGDAEATPDVTADETVSHYLFEGSVLWHLRNLSFASGSAIPYLSGGGGYLRELHEGNQLVETGQEYHALAGLNFWLGSGRHRFGLKLEGGMSARKKGFDSDDSLRMQPIVFAGVSYLF